jgi:D-lactate dehydrogenase
VRVPEYSPHAVAEHVVALVLTLNRKIHLITSYQAFLTKEALASIARVTLENVTAFERGESLRNEVRAEDVLQTAAPKVT